MNNTEQTAEKCKVYGWKGVDKHGDIITGMLVADSMVTAESQLHSQHIELLELKEKSGLFSGKALRRVTNDDVVVFARQLATMVSAGIPLVQAIESVAIGFDNLRMRAALLAIQRDISSGGSFSEALRRHPKYFDNLFCSLVKSGEQSGTLDVVLEQIANYLEKIAILKSRMKKAMFYPITIFSVAIVIAMVLLIFIVPQFANMFKSFKAELPLPTQIILSVSNFIQDYWYIALFVLVGSIVTVVLLNKRSTDFQMYLDKLKINIFIFGPLVRKAIIARSSRTLAITLGAGIPLVDALQCAAMVSNNNIYYKAIMRVRDDVMTGKKLYLSFQTSELFPAMMVQMISVGEQSGSLEAMLNKIADYFDQQVDAIVNNISTLIEPLLLVVLGVIIGGFVISMYLPIFKIGTLL